MLNDLWGGMIVTGIVFSIFQGKLPQLTNSILDCTKEAVDLCIMMSGIIAMWTGIMEIALKAGLMEEISKKAYPVFHFLFPDIKKGDPAQKYIIVNMIANILGLGWAATPAGIQAMKELQRLNKEKPYTASREMCTFLIMNISSLQLIPINIIAFRSRYGSVDPSYVVGPAIIATAVSTMTGVIFSKIMSH